MGIFFIRKWLEKDYILTKKWLHNTVLLFYSFQENMLEKL